MIYQAECISEMFKFTRYAAIIVSFTYDEVLFLSSCLGVEQSAKSFKTIIPEPTARSAVPGVSPGRGY